MALVVANMKTISKKRTASALILALAMGSISLIAEAGNPRDARKLFANKFDGKFTNARVSETGGGSYPIEPIKGDLRIKPPTGKKTTNVNEPVIAGEGGKLTAKTKQFKVMRNGKKGVANTVATFLPNYYLMLDHPSDHAFKGTIRGVSVLHGGDAKGKGQVKLKSKRPDFLGGGTQTVVGTLKGKE